MQKLYQTLSIFLLCYITACANNPVETYLSSNPKISSEIFLAIQNRSMVNGMNKEQVKLILGAPNFIENNSSQEKKLEKWIYRFQGEERNYKGRKKDPIQELEESSFPQGIGHIIPMKYKAREIRIEFEDAQVFRVQKIIAF